MKHNNVIPVAIEFFASHEHNSVLVKGSWDEWHSLTPLHQDQHEPKTWTVDINLTPGVFLFKFVVDDKWQHAPNYKQQSDGFGGYNNVLDIAEQPLQLSQPLTYDGLPQSEAHQQPNLESHESDTENGGNHKEPLVPSQLQSTASEEESTQHQSSLHTDKVQEQSPHKSVLSEEQGHHDSTQFVDAFSHQMSHISNASSKKACEPMNALVPFVYHVHARHAQVHVKGSWDQWQKRIPLVPSEHGYWHSNIALPPGSFLFKFVVDGKWTHSTQYEAQSDGFGGYNNFIDVKVSDCVIDDAQLVSYTSGLTAEPDEHDVPIGAQSEDETEQTHHSLLETPTTFSDISSYPKPFEAEVERKETLHHNVVNHLVPSSEIPDIISSDQTPHQALCVTDHVETEELGFVEMPSANPPASNLTSRSYPESSRLPVHTSNYASPDIALPRQNDNVEKELGHPPTSQGAQVCDEDGSTQMTQVVQVEEGNLAQLAQVAQVEGGQTDPQTVQVGEEDDTLQTTQVAQGLDHPQATVASVSEVQGTDDFREESSDEDDATHEDEPIACFAAPVQPEENEQDKYESDGEQSARSSTGKVARDHEVECLEENDVAEASKERTERGMFMSESGEQVPGASIETNDLSRERQASDSSPVTQREYSATTPIEFQEESTDGDTPTKKLKQILQGKLVEAESDVDLDESIVSVRSPAPKRKESRGCTMC